jgi:hypothetical protein
LVPGCPRAGLRAVELSFADVEALGSGFVAAVEERLVTEMLGHRTGRVNVVFIVFTSHQSEAAWV